MQNKNMKKKLTSLLLFIGLSLLLGCNGSVFDKLAGKTVKTVEISPGSGTIVKGLYSPLVATAIYTDGRKVDLSASNGTWTVDDDSIASIGSDGRLYAKSTGSIVVTLEYEGNKANATFTVSNAELVSIQVSPFTGTMANGTTLQYFATGIFTDSTTQDITSQVTWSSSVVGTATINTAGLTTSVGAGSTVITGTLNGKSNTSNLTVSAATLEGVTITSDTFTIGNGFNVQLTATGVFSDNSTQNLTTQVVWASSVGGVAAVSSSGLVTSVFAGSTDITATLSGKSDLKAVTVNAIILSSIDVTPKNPIALGTTQQFVATGTFSDSSTQDITSQVTWSSSTTSVASISNAGGTEGLATTAASGTSTITATSGAKTGDTLLEVKKVNLISIAVTPTTASKNINGKQNYFAAGTYSDGTIQDLTTQVVWSSSDNTKAIVDNSTGKQGIVTALASGTVTITATRTDISGTASFTVNPPDTSAPTVSAAEVLPGNKLRVTFSEDMDVAQAKLAANYKVVETLTGTCSTSDDLVFTNSTQTGDYNISSVTVESLISVILNFSAGTQAKSYKVVGSRTNLQDLATTNNKLGCSNSVGFVGLDTIKPYVVNAISTSPTTLNVTFSEDVQKDAGGDLTTAEFTFAEDPDDGGCEPNRTVSTVTKISDKVYKLILSGGVCAIQYKITVAANVKDLATSPNVLDDPKFATFIGNEQLKVVSATAKSLKEVVVVFSKALIATGDQSAICSTLGDCAKRYKFIPTLGGITGAVINNENTVTITHQDDQEGLSYNVIVANNLDGDGFDNVDVTPGAFTTIQASGPENLQSAPKDRTIFLGAGPVINSPEDGPQFTDPFGDGTSFGFSFVYNSRVYVGPNVTNASLVRFDATGQNLIQATFDMGSAYGATQRYDFGHETNDLDGGPDGIDGIGYFQAIDISGTPYLVAGAQEVNVTQPKLGQIYVTKDVDSVLDFITCGISAPANVKATSSVYGASGYLWVGMASDASSAKPGFDKVTIGVSSCTAETAPAGQSIPGVGASNPRAGNNDLFIGIDQMISFTRNSVNYLMIANNGGIATAVLSGAMPNSATNFQNSMPAAFNRSGSTSTRVYQKATTLQPWEKSISSVVDFDGKIYVARNRCSLDNAVDTGNCRIELKGDISNASNKITNSKTYDTAYPALLVVGTAISGVGIPGGTTITAISGNPTNEITMSANATTTTANLTITSNPNDNLTPELWKGECIGGAGNECENSTKWIWTKVWDATDFSTANGFVTNWGATTMAIGIMQVNGNTLYIGLDSTTDGAHMVSLATGTNPTSVTDFTEFGRANNASCSYLDGKAFGKDCTAKNFFSGSSINFSGQDFFYMSVGDGSDSMRVFRKVD